MQHAELNALIAVAELGDETDRLMLADALGEAGREEESELCRQGEVRVLTLPGRPSRFVPKDHVELVPDAADPTVFRANGPWSEYEAEMRPFEVFENPRIEVFRSPDAEVPVASYECWAELENNNWHAELLLRAVWRDIAARLVGDHMLLIQYPEPGLEPEVVGEWSKLAFDRYQRPSVRCIHGPDSVEDEDRASGWIPPDLAARGFVPRWPRPDLEEEAEATAEAAAESGVP